MFTFVLDSFQQPKKLLNYFNTIWYPGVKKLKNVDKLSVTCT